LKTIGVVNMSVVAWSTAAAPPMKHLDEREATLIKGQQDRLLIN
jgi:hypothetical protein